MSIHRDSVTVSGHSNNDSILKVYFFIIIYHYWTTNV